MRQVRGRCGRCSGTHAVRRDGTLWAHRGRRDGYWCEGSRTSPVRCATSAAHEPHVWPDEAGAWKGCAGQDNPAPAAL